MATRTIVHDRLSTLADPTRGRVLLMLENHELTVGELCQILQLPQSTVSRHLRVLGDEGWIVSRQEGTSRFYVLDPALESSAERLWSVVRDDLVRGPAVDQDRGRRTRVVAQRSSKSRAFFAASAAQWDAMREELFGASSDLTALLGLLDDRWTVGDLGCGTGRLSEVLSPNVERVIGVDASPEMLGAARERLSHLPNVELRPGDLEDLPIESGSLDAGVLSLVLHHAAEPGAVMREAYRTLRPGGRILVVDMLPHDRVEYRQQMGHLWQGFSENQVTGWLHDAGFRHARFHPLTPDSSAKGPTLFSASARKPGSTGESPTNATNQTS